MGAINLKSEDVRNNCVVLILLPLGSLERSLHDQKSWQEVDEDPPDPGRHQVGLRGPKVNIKDHNSHTDTASRHLREASKTKV